MQLKKSVRIVPQKASSETLAFGVSKGRIKKPSLREINATLGENLFSLQLLEAVVWQVTNGILLVITT